MTSTGIIGAHPRDKARFKILFIDVSDGRLDEMATGHISIAVYTKDRLARVALLALAWVVCVL